MDIALTKWLQKFKEILYTIEDFDKQDTYYYMPKTSLYIRGSTTLMQYMYITREKRTGSYKVIRNSIILFEFLYFKIVSLFKLSNLKIILPASESYFSIFIGNHRIRLTSILFDNDLVIDLTEPRPNFNRNSASVGDGIFSSISPHQCVMDDECRIISEERFSGVAINRLASNLIKETEITFISDYRHLIFKNMKNISTNSFVDNIRTTVFNSSFQKQLNDVANEYELTEFNVLVADFFEILCFSGPDKVTISTSHRDLNRGNVLACEGFNFRVIDWEFLGSAYYNYDMFIFLSNYRHSQDFGVSWKRYIEESNRFGIQIHEYEVLIFCLEEIVFFVDNYSVREWKNIRDFKVLVNSLIHARKIFYAS